MLTEKQVKALVYNAITGDSAILAILSTRLYWTLSPNINAYPLMTYQVLDVNPGYSFQPSGATSEQVDIQIDIYVDHKDIAKLDTLVERVKAVLVPLCFLQISGSPELVDEQTNKIVKSLRWRYTNV